MSMTTADVLLMRNPGNAANVKRAKRKIAAAKRNKTLKKKAKLKVLQGGKKLRKVRAPLKKKSAGKKKKVANARSRY